jgi:hypothetical protein
MTPSQDNTRSAASATPGGAAQPVPPPAASQRAANGQFAPGNIGGPGNPYNRKVAALRQAMLETITPEDLQEVLAAVLFKAKMGDLAAAKLLLSYTIGKPGAAVDPDTLDQQEWQMHQQAAVQPKQVEELLSAQPAATVNNIARIVWPCAARQQMQPVVEGLRAAETADSAGPTPPRARPETSAATKDQNADLPSPKRPSANAVIGEQDRPPKVRSARASRPATPRPPNLPAYIDWEAEQRIMDILFSEEESPPDSKRLNPGSD